MLPRGVKFEIVIEKIEQRTEGKGKTNKIKIVLKLDATCTLSDYT